VRGAASARRPPGGGRETRRRDAVRPDRCRGRCRRICAIRPGRPSAASPLAAWNSACGGIRSSRSPCTSNTGGRDFKPRPRAFPDWHRAGAPAIRNKPTIATAPRAAQPHMQRHHRTLAEADERERRGRQIAALSSASRKLARTGAALLTPVQRSSGSRKVSGNIAGQPAPGCRARGRAATTKAAWGKSPCHARPMSMRSLPSAPCRAGTRRVGAPEPSAARAADRRAQPLPPPLDWRAVALLGRAIVGPEDAGGRTTPMGRHDSRAAPSLGSGRA